MMKTKICWITATYFLDVDVPVVPILQKYYDIDWIILTNRASFESDTKVVKSLSVFNVRVELMPALFISLKTFMFYKNLLKDIASKQYDLFYLDLSGMPYFHLLARYYLPVEKCVIAAHNVTTPKGARYYYLAKPYMEYIVGTFKKFHVFSKNQYEVLKSMKTKADVLYAPLCLKDYGSPSVDKPQSPVTFLFFGNIVQYKRLDVLLNATNLLIEKGFSNFKVKICGYCPRQIWDEQYKQLILNDNIVHCDIRRIPNDLVANCFESSHYFVMPYQDIAQSGAMTVAFCYNLPIIASELETFKEFLNDGVDGFFFKSGCPEELAERMEYVIENHDRLYNDLRENQKKMVENNLSTIAIVEKYKSYIESICQN